jgi:peptidoglycan hydrolase-like protein with peptidoglycan-binding domain
MKCRHAVVLILAASALLGPFAHAQTHRSCPLITRYLTLGSRHREVVALKLFLADEGLLSGLANTTYFGPSMQTALKAWQKKQGLVSTGSPATTGYGATGPRTRERLARCGRAEAPISPSARTSPLNSTTFTRSLARGMSGEDVKGLQRILQQTGDYTEPELTGFFGAITEQALRKYQLRTGLLSNGTVALTENGIAGPITIARLMGSAATITTPPATTLSPATTVTASLASPIIRESDNRRILLTASQSNSSGASSTIAHAWSVGTWGTCSNGQRTRSVACLAAEATPAADPLCGADKPTVTEPCTPLKVPRVPRLSPEHGNGLAVALGTAVTITSENATTIHYTMNNAEPTCSTGLLYADDAKPVITTNNTTLKAIGCNESGASPVTPRWYYSTTPHSTLFNYQAVRNGVGRDANGFDVLAYATPHPSGAVFVANKVEFVAALAAAQDGQTIILRNGSYDLGRQQLQRPTSAAGVTIRAETPGCFNAGSGSGVTLTGGTQLRIMTDAWTIEGLCFETLSNQTVDETYSKAVQISARRVTLSQNTFKNIGTSSNVAVVVMIGGGTNLAGERKVLEGIVVTRNLFSSIQGIGIDLPQPSAVYTGPYLWALRPVISYNTFEHAPLTFDNGGEALHVGAAWDFSDAFNDTMGAEVAHNFFDRWDGDGELMSIKSTGNFIEDNLIYNAIGSISVRAGDHNTIQRNYIINSDPSCHGFRASGTGNIFDNNVLDLHPLCVAWLMTAKHLDTAPYPDGSYTVATYPAKKNYFRRNKVKNAQTIIGVLKSGSNHRWEHTPPTDADLPTDNTLRLNEFYNMQASTPFHSDLPQMTVSVDRLLQLNTIGTDNVYAN